MRERGSVEVKSQIDLAQYAGFPVYFFEFGALLASVPAIAGWSRNKLETVIGTRADNMLGRADVRIPVPNGFFVIFSSHEPNLAQERANAICTDILRHFFGTESLIPETAQAFCRPSDLKAIAGELGLPPPSVAEIAAAAEAASSGQPPKLVMAESESGPLIAEMNTLFRRHFGEERGTAQRFVFAPVWDSAHERIAFFSCQPVQPAAARTALQGDKSAAAAAIHCAADIAALGVALKGVWRLVSRGDLALITVPVHIETLSWSKHRTAYLNALAQIEQPLLNLLAFRIYGLDMGSSLAQLSQGVSVLRRHTKRIFAHLPSVNLDFSHAGLMGLNGIAVSAPSHMPRAGEGSLDGLAQVAMRLKRICASQNAIACMDNVHSGAAVVLLKSHGVRLIAGSIFGPSSEDPSAVRSLPLSAIAHTQVFQV